MSCAWKGQKIAKTRRVKTILVSIFHNFLPSFHTSNYSYQYADISAENSGESLPELKRQLREKDEKIMHLEGEVAKWEQRYLEESELRQAAIDAASIPK